MASVVIVDDNIQSAELLARLLSQSGHVAICIYGGQEGIEAIRRLRPDLLLLDVNLPGINGIEILRLIRGYRDIQNIRVVILSGVLDVHVQAEAFSLGALDYLMKGLDWAMLLKRIECHLPGA